MSQDINRLFNVCNAVIWVVGTQCRPGVDEDKFNKWYDEVHVPMLLEGNLVKKVTRNKISDKSYHVANATQECPKYLAIYEFEKQEAFESWMTAPERDAAGEDKLVTWGEGGGYEVLWATRYDNMQTWEGQNPPYTAQNYPPYSLANGNFRMRSKRSLVVKSDITDNAKTIGDHVEFVDIAEMAIDIKLLDNRIGRGA